MLTSILRLSMGSKTKGHIWPRGHTLPTPDFRKGESKEKKKATLQNKISKSALIRPGCNN